MGFKDHCNFFSDETEVLPRDFLVGHPLPKLEIMLSQTGKQCAAMLSR